MRLVSHEAASEESTVRVVWHGGMKDSLGTKSGLLPFVRVHIVTDVGNEHVLAMVAPGLVVASHW